MGLISKSGISRLVQSYRNDYIFATAIAAGISACVNIAFVLFNGIFGLIHASVWHISIFVYYAMLLLIRGHILVSLRRKRAQRPVYIRTHAFLVLLNLSLIVPSAVMIYGQREYKYGLIPAIAMAAYTTYRVIVSAAHIKRSKKSGVLLIRALRTINLADSLVAVMSLQNTLIMANGGMTAGMRTLCAWTNGGLILLIFLITLFSFLEIRHSQST